MRNRYSKTPRRCGLCGQSFLGFAGVYTCPECQIFLSFAGVYTQCQGKGGPQTNVGIKVRIWWDEKAQAYVVSSTFKQGFVEAIKQFIPSGSRDWDPTTKFWYVKEGYEEFIRKLAEQSFGIGSVSFTSRTVTQQSQQAYAGATVQRTSNSTEQAVVDFFNLVPYEAAKRCYLLTAQQLHPDKGGDPQKMSRLNELWDRLEKEFFKR